MPTKRRNSRLSEDDAGAHRLLGEGQPGDAMYDYGWIETLTPDGRSGR
jgi:hypothetical protein